MRLEARSVPTIEIVATLSGDSHSDIDTTPGMPGPTIVGGLHDNRTLWLFMPETNEERSWDLPTLAVACGIPGSAWRVNGSANEPNLMEPRWYYGWSTGELRAFSKHWAGDNAARLLVKVRTGLYMPADAHASILKATGYPL